MANLLAHFELSELVDFMNFISLLIHKLQVCPIDFVYILLSHVNAHSKICLTS